MKRNLLAGFVIFGMAFTLLLVSCTPIGGTLDDIREKAWEENHGNDGGMGSVSSTVITSVNIQITAPAKGVAPSTMGSTTDTGYSLASVSWQPNNNPFQGSTKYTTTVTLVANSGYTFTGLTSAKINTSTAIISNNTGGSVILSYEFPATLANTVTGITIYAQPTKLSYKQEETLNLAGLIVTLTYDAGPADNVAFANFGTYGITTSPVNGTTLSRSTHDGKPVTVSHGSFSKATNNLTVIAPPDMPQNFSATAGNGQVTLSWSSQTESGGSAITGYQVYRDGTGGGTWITATSNTSHTFTGLTYGTSYNFKVRAVNAAGNGAEASLTKSPITTPSIPLNFNAVPGDKQVTLSWTAPASDGGSTITGYQVSSNNGGAWSTASSSTGHTFTGLANGTSYTFKVRAVNAAGNGAEASISATPVAKTYTVTFYSNGGSSVTSQTVTEGGYATRPLTNPTRENYEFVNWYLDSSFNMLFEFESTPINANTPIYAKWNNKYNVRYIANYPSGTTGSGAMDLSNHVYSISSNLRTNNFSCRSYEFKGWSKTTNGNVDFVNNASVTDLSTTAGATVDLYANWGNKITDVPGENLAEKFTWLGNNAISNTEYTVKAVVQNEPLVPQTFDYVINGNRYENVIIRLKGASSPGENRTVALPSGTKGALFTVSVNSGSPNLVTLILEDYITLKGVDGNNNPVVQVLGSGAFIMNANSTITGNTNSGNGGGVLSGGTFTMNGGTISNNSASNGGGVYAGGGTYAVFTMNGGTISDNTATAWGGGVYVSGGNYGTFKMTGGTITRNKVQPSTGYGGGVYIDYNANIEKTGSSIITGYGSDTTNGNQVVGGSNRGHAVYVNNSTGSAIRRKENTAGAGVNLDSTVASTGGGWDN